MIQQTAPDTTDEIEELLSDEEAHSIKKKGAIGAVSYFIRTLFLQGIGLASAAALSVFFTPEDFGIYGLVTQIIGLLIFVSDVGLAAALIQKKEKPSLVDYRTAFTVQQLLSWLIFGMATAIAFSGFVEQKTGMAGVWILVSLGLSFPLATFKTVSSIMLERELDFNKLVLPQIVEQISFHGVLLYLAWQGMGAMAYSYAIIVRSVLGALIMFVLRPWQIGVAINKSSLKELLGYGVKFQINDFLARVKDNLFYLALGFFLPLRQFGYIQWAKVWSTYPYNLTVQNIMAVTFPTFSRLQGNKKALKEAIELSLFFISLAIFPILVGMSLFILPLTQVIGEYSKWQPAIFSFILFALSIGWGAISTPLVNTLNAIGQINQTLKLMTVWTVMTWVLTPAAIWLFGYNGVAIASLVIAFTSFIPIIMVKKIVPINAWEQVWRQLLAAGVMALVGVSTMSLWSQSIAWLALGTGVVGGSYVMIMGLLGFNKIKRAVEHILL